MGLPYLLDTNTASYVIKGNIPATRLRLAQIPMEQVHISSITEAELRYGAARRPDATTLHEIIEEFLLRTTSWPGTQRRLRSMGYCARVLSAPDNRSAILT